MPTYIYRGFPYTKRYDFARAERTLPVIYRGFTVSDGTAAEFGSIVKDITYRGFPLLAA